MKSKKPDQVVWDDDQEKYIARLLPFAAQNSGPVIKIPNVDAFKQKGVDKVSKQFQAELKELQSQIKSFVKLASETQKVYEAIFKFEPIVGETYHLYKGKEQNFLSLVAPSEWDKEFLGSFRLNSDFKWVRQ